MSADIFKHGKIIWSSQSWLFYLIIETLADSLADTRLSQNIREIADANLGDLNIESFTPEEQVLIQDTIITTVIPAITAMPFRDESAKPAAIAALDKLKTALA